MKNTICAQAWLRLHQSVCCQYAYSLSGNGAPAYQRYFSSPRRLAGAYRSYAHAIKLLDSLQSNRTVISAISKASSDANENAIPEMLEWTRRAGYAPNDFERNGLRCIHIAGTKGKGSVCMMAEKILLQYQAGHGRTHLCGTARLGKIGLYTSPHLIHVRERIRIDGAPISETMFAHYFFDVWERLSQTWAGTPGSNLTPTAKPGYFRYLTLMAFHIFVSEGVETAIIECGIGGEYDSTNILPASAVTATAITRLGIDHIGMLGSTLDSIAWHKAGIMKTGVPAFTAIQEPAARDTLISRAREKSVKLEFVARLPALDNSEIKLGVDGDFQKDNASIAVAVASSHLNTLSIPHTKTAIEFIRGLETSSHAGRCQTIIDGQVTWHLDGAHTLESITEASLWFKSKCTEARASGISPTKVILIFAAQGEGRDPQNLLDTLLLAPATDVPDTSPRDRGEGLLKFTHVCFSTLDVFKDSIPRSAEQVKQKNLTIAYEHSVERSARPIQAASIQEAVESVKQSVDDGDRIFAFVTGSLHLVGGVLQVLDLDKDRGK